ncbi:MAG TPA: 3-deoxy-manno-octulosonate cytidylyltransferase [Candidatus Brocadiia bacterium]|nr:3-deoxy-manno-octulosonate cytidylyltransferase [Candidatus Brocadiia bacterium]
MTRAAVVIPARYGSTRLEGKPILPKIKAATGKHLIQHVYERAMKAGLANRVIVATDDDRIFRAVKDFGGDAMMTRSDHRSGSDRIAEVAAGLAEEIIVNVQGDEPEVAPEMIDQVIDLLAGDPAASMSTLAHPIRAESELRDPASVKVVVDNRGYAMYFSRSPIPHVRGADEFVSASPLAHLKHIGMYAYRREFLLGYADLPRAPIEDAEKLEQLRALCAGHKIKVGVTQHRVIGIDTDADVEDFLANWKSAMSRRDERAR